MMAAQRPSTSGDPRPRAAGWIAWGLWAVTAILTVAAIVLAVVTRSVPHSVYDQWHLALLRTPGQLAFPTVGLLVAARKPANPLGWLLLLFGFSLAANEFLRVYAEYALLYRPGSLPAGLAVAWGSSWVWAFIYPVLPFVFLLFPDGRLPSRRWRPFAWVAVLVNGLFLLMVPFRAGGLETFPTIPNPVGIPALTRGVFELFALVTFVVIMLATTSLPVRFRRAQGEERQQLKWVAYGAVLLGAAVLLAPLWSAAPLVSAVVATVAFTGFAAAIAVAILKYRLYDIDRIINRTLVYGSLTALLGAVYAGAVLVLGQVFGGIGADPPSWVVAGATLAVAALFQPARRRIQQTVDQRFNRRKYDAAKAIEAFSTRLREQIDLDTLSSELLAVVDQTMQPTTASLWLRPSARPLASGQGQES